MEQEEAGFKRDFCFSGFNASVEQEEAGFKRDFFLSGFNVPQEHLVGRNNMSSE